MCNVLQRHLPLACAASEAWRTAKMRCRMVAAEEVVW